MHHHAETLVEGVTLIPGDCLDVLKTLEPNSVDVIVTDPPYGLEFMGKGWDGADGFRRSLNKADVGRESVFGCTSRRAPEYGAGRLLQVFVRAVAKEAIRVLKPGGFIVAFGGTRTYHRMACAIEDAGFEVRDMMSWLYGSGFPKSLDVSKAIDRAAGDKRPVIASEKVRDIRNGHGRGLGDGINASERDGPSYMRRDITSAASAASAAWDGWGTALKPACEPIVLARKPLSESTVAANVLKWGTGALNIDNCRVGSDTRSRSSGVKISENLSMAGGNYSREFAGTVEGRWPANVIHDGSDEVVDAFPSERKAGGAIRADLSTSPTENVYGDRKRVGTRPGGFANVGAATGDPTPNGPMYSDAGSAARFFYTAKADSDDRLGSKHPTVKPVDLMQYLVRLVTPPKGLVLDPFAGTGTTGEACIREGMRCILIEREPEYQDDIRRRMRLAMAGPDERARESIKARNKDKAIDPGPLFGGMDTPPVAREDQFMECSPTKADAHGNNA